MKYQIEGEKREKLPFAIDQISIVSTADGLKNQENTEYLWSGNLLQINDIYIRISKNENIDSILENVIIQNIEVTKPAKGEISLARIIKTKTQAIII